MSVSKTFPEPVTDAPAAGHAKCTPKHLQTLSHEQLKDINRALADIDKASKRCDDAEQCGDDCSDSRSDLEAMRQQLLRYKEKFFPNAA